MANHLKKIKSSQKHRIISSLCFSFILATTINCTGRSNIYKKATASVDQRVEDLLSRMTLDEKIGQMTQIEKDVVYSDAAKNLYEGSVLSGGGGSPQDNTVQGWRSMINDIQKKALAARLGIPILYGNDSVHGQNNLKNATIFPHNIGLGAADDEDLIYRIGKADAEETAACGITWAFGPCIAVLRDPRWGRSYESYGEDTEKVSQLAAAFIKGFQSVPGMLSNAKHFIGDGGTAFGSSKTDNYLIDQGDTQCSEEYLIKTYLPPYKATVDSGVRIIMASFSSWNGTKMHENKYLLTDVLKNELGFTGFVISDWAGIDQVDSDYEQAVIKCINAGIDMNMVPYDGANFQKAVKAAIASGAIKKERIDDAVRRILRVKFESGLFEHPLADDRYDNTVRSKEHLALAREAAAKSVVILKNEDHILPLKKAAKLYLCGSGADDIGRQCGGWTITWQGRSGPITAGTTIREALEQQYSDMEYAENGNFTTADKKAICIVVVSENPYAEGKGDSKTLALPSSDIKTFSTAAKTFKNIVLVVLSGRPVILGSMADNAAAITAAWLPGSEGGNGVTDILTGAVVPTGKLPVDWPKNTDQLPYDNFISGKEKPLYPTGFGLSW